jgi:hemolysin-activating ACP:hemolysin acyltransferase
MGAVASKLVSASIGDIAVVFSRSESHKHYSLADIQWMIMPPVVLGQFYVAELAHKDNGVRAPVASVTWAYVSPEVDQRLRSQAAERVTLAPAEWKSGEIAWLIDMAGEPASLASALRHLHAMTFENKLVNVWTSASSGRKQVLSLEVILNISGQSGAAA